MISYASAWELLQANRQAVDDINYALSLMTLEDINAEGSYRAVDGRPLPIALNRCWDRIAREQDWGSYRISSDKPGGISIFVRNYKHRVSIKILAADRLSMFLNWVLVEAPRIVGTEFCDIAVLLVPMDSLRKFFVERPGLPLFSFDRALAQLSDLLPMNQVQPFVVLGFSLDQAEPEVIDIKPLLKENSIERVLEFSPEHYQAGVGILSYFGEVIKQKYPDVDAKVRIEQDGNIVRMTVDAPDGTRDVIEKTLEDYALVISGRASPESLFDHQLQIHALSGKLMMAELEVRQARELNRITEGLFASRVQSLEEEVGFLRSHVGLQMRQISGAQNLLSQQSQKEERLLLAHIESSRRSIDDLVQDAWNSAELKGALLSIKFALEQGVTTADEPKVRDALSKVRDISPGTFSDLSEAVKNTMYGVSGNTVFTLLQQVSQMLF